MHGLLADAFEHVRIDVCSDRDGGVPEELLDDADIHSGTESAA